jgi:hypothetical protein
MDKLIQQLDVLLEKHSEFQKSSKHQDLSDISKLERQSLVTRALAAINRISGSNSIYAKEVFRILKESPQIHRHTSSIMGIVDALKEDLNAGYIKTLIELVHADVFANFLDMAYHLHQAGYKDAAAVITGSTLETHIKELCLKNAIDTSVNGRPSKADKLNADLAKTQVYSKLDQKNVTAWLDIRNKAAHGNYSEYSLDQVELFISGVRDFIGRVPA